MKYCKYIFLLIYSLSVLVSCKNKTKDTFSIRDTVTQNYLRYLDSSGQLNNSDNSIRTLQAYIQNDTLYFKKLQNSIEEDRNRAYWDVWESDIPLKKIQELDIDEGYRFVFSLLGTPLYQVITISKKDSVYNFHYLQFSRDYFTKIPNKGEEFRKTIDEEDWNRVAFLITESDFWNLRKGSKGRGSDGSDLTVFGFIRESKPDFIPKQFNCVHRWGNFKCLNSVFQFIYFNLLEKKYRMV